MRVCDIMHKGVIFCYPEDNLKTVAAMLKENHLRSIVVMHESGEVWGLISYFEVIKQYGQDLTAISAEQAMQAYKIDVDPQWPIEKAVDPDKVTAKLDKGILTVTFHKLSPYYPNMTNNQTPKWLHHHRGCICLYYSTLNFTC